MKSRIIDVLRRPDQLIMGNLRISEVVRAVCG